MLTGISQILVKRAGGPLMEQKKGCFLYDQF